MPNILTRFWRGHRAAAGRCVLAGLAVAGISLTAPSNATEAHMLPKAERDQTLVIGRITRKISKQYEKLEALNDYLIPKLAAAGITRGKVILASDSAHMATLLQTGQVDYFSETAFAALRLEMDGQAAILLHEWKNGRPIYKSLFIVPKTFAPKDGAAGIAALAGQRLVFEDSDSTSGYMLPYLYLVQHGLRPTPADSLATATPDSTIISYNFAGDETSVLARVLRGRATAGVVSDTEWSKELKTPAFRKNLRVIAETEAVVRSLTMVRASLPAERQAALARALVALNDDEAAAEIKKVYFSTSKFVPLSKEARKQLAGLRTRIARHMPEP